jgi:hypothetical protein
MVGGYLTGVITHWLGWNIIAMVRGIQRELVNLARMPSLRIENI